MHNENLLTLNPAFAYPEILRFVKSADGLSHHVDEPHSHILVCKDAALGIFYKSRNCMIRKD